MKSKSYRQWIKQAKQEAIIGMMGKVQIVGSFKATLHLAADGDLDNRIKGTLDLCKTVGAIEDDKHLVELHVFRQPGEPGIWIVLEPA